MSIMYNVICHMAHHDASLLCIRL